MTAAPFLGYSPMTDTTEIPMLSGARLAQAHTQWIPFPLSWADPPASPEPTPPPVRLPKRLRRRAAQAYRSALFTRLALLTAAIGGFATAIGAA